jgi:hypothetical protein
MPLDFSMNGYGQLLDHLDSHGYETIRFGELRMQSSRPARCLLRHDVDTSTDFAVQMAEFEAARQVRSTYFVMLRSPLYNALSRACTDDVRRIVELGHEVGLHVDAAYDPTPSQPIAARIERELAVLSGMTGVPVSAFSFHQPDAALLASRIVVTGAVNAYTLDSDGWQYISDSNRDWRGRDVLAMIGQRGLLQILVHPMWWVCDSQHILDCWDQAIAGNFERGQRQLLTTERAYGPPRRIEVKR